MGRLTMRYTMTVEEARARLGLVIGDFVNWEPGDDLAELDGVFTVDQLRALVWLMENQVPLNTK
jgi:hypothetical protein